MKTADDLVAHGREAEADAVDPAPSRLPFVSVDDHVIEPRDLWLNRLPSKYLDVAPRLLDTDGVEMWHFDGKTFPLNGFTLAKDVDPSMHLDAYTIEAQAHKRMRPGCYSVPERLADMDTDGVLASLCFSSWIRFTGQVLSNAKDKELGLLCIQAYNDWMIEEWCGAAPSRLIPLCIVPLWDPELGAREVERVAAKGARGISFSEGPAALGYPSLHDPDQHWAPLFDTVSEADLPLCAHVGTASTTVGPGWVGDDAPQHVLVMLMPLNAQIAMIDWLLSGVFVHHPKLKLVLSEGGIGWIPYTLERADYTWRHRHWRDSILTEAPSSYFRDHIYGCFIDDVHGVKSLDSIGVDNVMMESDYPHSDSTWPHSSEIAARTLADVDDETRYKLTIGNASRLFRFTPGELGSR